MCVCVLEVCTCRMFVWRLADNLRCYFVCTLPVLVLTSWARPASELRGPPVSACPGLAGIVSAPPRLRSIFFFFFNVGSVEGTWILTLKPLPLNVLLVVCF